MKRIRIGLIYFLCVLPLLVGVSSCTDDLTSDGTDRQLRFLLTTPGSDMQTRATEEVAGEDAWGENTLDRIDLFVFSSDGGLVEYRAFSDLDAEGSYTVVSNHAKTDFKATDRFNVYVIANYPGAATDLSAIVSIDGLQALAVADADVFKRAAERRFLMDGVVNDVQFNDEQTTVTTIPVSLKRAAAKIKVNLKCTDNFEKDNSLVLMGYSGYRLMNYVAETRVLDEAVPLNSPALSRQTAYTPVTNAELGKFQPGTGEGKGGSFYVYTFANDWSGEGMDVNNATYFIVNLPYTLKDQPEDTNNYYKIPVNYNQYSTKEGDNCLQRNYFYEVNATINKIGSKVEEVPVTLQANYRIADWNEKDVTVEGGSSGDSSVRYLMVSETEVTMKNITEYNGVKYYASHPIKIGAVTVTYINNRGVETTVTESNCENLGFDTNALMNSLDYMADLPSPRGYVRPVKSEGNDVTGEENGYLEIKSNLLNLSEKNSLLVKKFVFTVTLNDGGMPELTRTITVTQHPEIYVTQTQGWFSFKTPMSTSTSSSNREWGAYRQCSLNDIAEGIGKVTHNKGYNGLQKDDIFTSKAVRTYPNTEGNSTLYVLNEYDNWEDIWSLSNPNWNNLNNAHIYHIHISTIPDDKTLAYPNITGGATTDNSVENARTISPAFMIASQLGAVTAPNNLAAAHTHCQNYVEVTYRSPTFSGRLSFGNYDGQMSDWVVYSDWRLPTASEIGIIANYQNNNGAIATVLAGSAYSSYTGINNNPWTTVPGGSGGKAVRCVRDVKPGDPNYDN